MVVQTNLYAKKSIELSVEPTALGGRDAAGDEGARATSFYQHLPLSLSSASGAAVYSNRSLALVSEPGPRFGKILPLPRRGLPAPARPHTASIRSSPFLDSCSGFDSAALQAFPNPGEAVWPRAGPPVAAGAEACTVVFPILPVPQRSLGTPSSANPSRPHLIRGR